MMNYHVNWINLLIVAGVCAGCFFGTWAALTLCRSEGARVWVAGLAPLICMAIGAMAVIAFPIL